VQQASSNTGTCGLCRVQDIALCYSDLLPKAIARWVRLSAQPGQDNPNPYFITPDGSRQVNYRVAEHFLCPDCEDRLNKGGETWTLKHSYRGGSAFPLRDALLSAPSVFTLRQIRIIETKALAPVQIDKLIYFAVSVFWKASARQWWGVDHPVRLSLGPYEEELRMFLLGKATLSNRVAVIINVSANREPLIGATYPYGGEGRVQGTRQYRSAIPGMAFWLHLGNIPQALRALSATHTGVLCLASDLNETYLSDMTPLVARAEQAWKRRTGGRRP
jgi:hypothetical protein